MSPASQVVQLNMSNFQHPVHAVGGSTQYLGLSFYNEIWLIGCSCQRINCVCDTTDLINNQFSLTVCPQVSLESGSVVGAVVGTSIGLTLLYAVILLVWILWSKR